MLANIKGSCKGMEEPGKVFTKREVVLNMSKSPLKIVFNNPKGLEELNNNLKYD